MSVLDQIRKLEEQKSQLLQAAKQEALQKANQAIKELQELGYEYRLVAGDNTETRTGSRRTGIREEVLSHIKNADGITRAQLLETMGAKGTKSAEQSISNALAALKKAGTIGGDNGIYRAT